MPDGQGIDAHMGRRDTSGWQVDDRAAKLPEVAQAQHINPKGTLRPPWQVSFNAMVLRGVFGGRQGKKPPYKWPGFLVGGG
jgi:hypothetical protein